MKKFLNQEKKSLIFLLLLFPIAIIYSRYVYAPCDDAYIFFVYARNFIEGNGLTYNGIIVEGFSSVLWVMALSVLGFTKIDLPLLAEILSILTGLFTLFATYLLARSLQLDRFWALLPPILLVATGDFVFYMSVGLEQVLFTGMVALCVALSYSQNTSKLLNSYYFPFLMAAIILIRPEGALISALLLGILTTRSRSIFPAVRCGIVLTLILVPMFLLRWMYYGYWLPNTYYAKSAVDLSNFSHGLTYLSGSFYRYGVILILGISITLWGFYKDKHYFFDDVWSLLLISAVWTIYIAVQGGDNMVGGRLLLPILPLVYVTLVKLITNTQLQPKPMIFIVILAAISLTWGYLLDPDVKTHANNWRVSYTKRKNMGIYLRENYPPDTLVALNPAGIIPYYSKLPTIDMLGINDVYIAHYGKRDNTLRYGHQAGDGMYVLAREPDIILFGSGNKKPADRISDQELWNSPQFHEMYKLQEWPTVGYAYVKSNQ